MSIQKSRTNLQGFQHSLVAGLLLECCHGQHCVACILFVHNNHEPTCRASSTPWLLACSCRAAFSWRSSWCTSRAVFSASFCSFSSWLRRCRQRSSRATTSAASDCRQHGYYILSNSVHALKLWGVSTLFLQLRLPGVKRCQQQTETASALLPVLPGIAGRTLIL